jgi:glycosyltransferase involved in cell wall biosynthesis
MRKLSIVTINLNNAKGLQKTLESVVDQSFVDFELLVIDGGSTDGSAEVIRQYENKISYWVSEPDKGIYHAMNKGIKLTTGSYILFLNSGDSLVKNSILDDVFKVIKSNTSIDFFYGDTINARSQAIHTYPTTLTFSYFYERTINHQSTIFKKDLFVNYGLYTESFRIVSDWEYYLKLLFLNQCSYMHVNFPIVVFDYDHGLSTSPCAAETIKTERELVLKKYFPHFISDYEFLRSITNSRPWRAIGRINKIKDLFRR